MRARRSTRWCSMPPIATPSAAITRKLRRLNLPSSENRRSISRLIGARAAKLSAASSYPGAVPEGDTIHYAANRIRPVLAGRVPDEVRTLHPRFAAGRWAERLAGRAVRAVDARGKHLLIRFEGGLTIHSHLRMTGHWSVLRDGRRWPRSARRAWLVMERGGA